MSSYLRPRRGKKSTAIAQLTSANPLKRGEIFFEVPDDGVGTGPGKIKMGDGTTGYEDLPYFSEGIGGTDVTIALPTSGWGAETISGETYYTQTVTVLGATANSTPIIVPVFSTDAEMEAYTNILRVETSSNAFKFIAIAAPEASLTVVAKSVLEATGSQTADLSQITSHLNTIDGQITQLNNDLDSKPFYYKEITTQDLNNITTFGYYIQGSSTNATADRHYPCNMAGLLEVSGQATDVIQKYRPYGTSYYPVTLMRRYYHGAWSSWISTDFVRLGYINSQNITTSGLNINIPRSVIVQTRELTIKIYGYKYNSATSFGADSQYISFTYAIDELNPSVSNRINLRWDTPTATTGKVYLLNSSNTPISGTIPALDILGKIGTAFADYYV